MTIIDDREQSVRRQARAPRPSSRPFRPAAVRCPAPSRPGPSRPAITPLSYRGANVGASSASHKPRPVGVGVTLALSALSAFITFWLGVLGHSSAGSTPAAVSDRVAVVRVQAGETLERLAERVAPDQPAGQVMQRIRELNKLGAASVEAGQTLISPIG